MKKESKKGDGTRKLIKMGTDLGGGAVGGFLGFLAGGPIGSAVGGAGGVLVTKIFERVGDELAVRLLGPREGARIGAVLSFAVNKIQTNITSGKPLRSDDFFDTKPNVRATAEEIAEATLLAAQRDHQEQKLEYYGNLLANIASDETFNRSQANKLINELQNLSWTQLCIMSIATGGNSSQLHKEGYRGQGTFTQPLIFTLTEIMDLYHRGFINFGGEALLGPTDITPSKMKLQGVGSHLYNLMELWKIPESEKLHITEILK